MSNSQTKEPKDKKVRVFALAKELNLESKVLVDLCKELGFAGITNQLNGLDPDQIDTLKERIKKGPKANPAAAAAPARPLPPASPPKLETKILTIPKAKPVPPKPAAAAEPPAPAPVPAAVAPEAPAVTAPVEVPAPEPEVPVAAVAPVVAASAPPQAPVAPAAPPARPQNVIPSLGGSRMADLNRRPQAPARVPPAGNRPAAPTAPAPAAPVAPAAPLPPAPVEVVASAPAAPVEVAPPSRPAAPAAPAPELTAKAPPQAPAPAAPPPSRPVPQNVTGNIPTRPSTPPTLGSASSGGSRPPTLPPSGSGGPPRPNVLSRPPQVPPPRPGITAPPRHGPGGAGGPPRAGGGPAAGTGHGAPPRPGPGGKPPVPGGRPTGPTTSVKLTPEMIDRLRRASQSGQKMTLDQITKAPTTPPGGDPSRGPGQPPRPGAAAAPGARPATPGVGRPAGSEIVEEEDDKKKGPGGVIGRDSRHKGRQDKGRTTAPRVDRGAIVLGPGGQVEMLDSKFGSRRGPRAALLRKHMRGKVQPIIKEGKIEISPPINVRSLSEAIGMKSGELSKRLLKETDKLYGVNSTIEFDVAALIALEKNIELVLKLQKSAEDILLENFERHEREVDVAKLQPRPPIVTIMGHVDHGKTSLLDKIRSSKVVDTEIGGITQVIRAWSVIHNIDDPDNPGEKLIERPITFLDTPGHEAFTKMRARGANVTDIAVIVVAATDGVMPQTEEAIAHARAADVRIIIAINKVDMPNANVDRTRRQLYSLNLLPDDMGGDTQFIETSAATGQGIDDLLTAILLEAELNLSEDLQADPDRPATGTCLEAYMTGDEGVMATVIVQQGTLKRGDIVLCGSTFGRVRAMYNDLGRSVKEAGPSTPVRITGLNEVPNADDPFYAVEELSTAQEIAEVRRQKERETLLNKFAPVSLESLAASRTKIKISELKIILKAEARGSVEAIRKELEKLTHEEVRTRVLHAGIGAITESDVQLALTSPDDTLIVGFNVTADDAALRLVEERALPPIREYNIIYNLVDDIKAALEGRLKPIQEVVHLGRAVVRETFKISKTGTIAGCYVTSGTIERSAKVRIIREGVVVFPQGDKEVGLDSLKRFKDDAKDVREGFECGIKVTGYNDIKNGDVIEAYRIESRQRTL